MSSSLFVSLVLCFKGAMSMAGEILLILRNWESWSHRPFIMGQAEDELSLLISTKILSIALLESL